LHIGKMLLKLAKGASCLSLLPFSMIDFGG
jgi:hypothetical protein